MGGVSVCEVGGWCQDAVGKKKRPPTSGALGGIFAFVVLFTYLFCGSKLGNKKICFDGLYPCLKIADLKGLLEML